MDGRDRVAGGSGGAAGDVRAGAPGPARLDGSPSPAGEALALAHTPPGWPPGERARYSNVGYAVLGLVLERVAGGSYAEALQRHVLDPCAMTASEAVTTAEAQARAATGHLELAGGALAPEWPDGDSVPLTPLPGGGFRVGNDPDSPERAAFEAEVEGRPMRVVVSGWPFDRVD